MKLAVVFVFVALASIVYAAPQDGGYSTKYDNIDLDEILTNDRLLDNYMACAQGIGKCTAEGEELKKNLIDGIETCCSKCSEKQKKGVQTVFDYLEKHRADQMKEFKAKYDPTGEKEVKCRKALAV